MVKSAMSGFQKCTVVSAHYSLSDVFDNIIIITLCKFTAFGPWPHTLGVCNNSTWRMYACAPLCTRMHQGAARSASLVAGSSRCISSLAEDGAAMSGSWPHTLGVCNNSTWRMYACAPLCTRMHQGAARSASLVAGSSRCISSLAEMVPVGP